MLQSESQAQITVSRRLNFKNNVFIFSRNRGTRQISKVTKVFYSLVSLLKHEKSCVQWNSSTFISELLHPSFLWLFLNWDCSNYPLYNPLASKESVKDTEL